MPRRYYTNTAATASLPNFIDATATSLTLNGYSGFPAVPFYAAIDRGTADEEIVYVTAVALSTLTVQRGADGTTAKSHTGGAAFEHVAVAKDFDEANAHVNATTGVHGLTGQPAEKSAVDALDGRVDGIDTRVGAAEAALPTKAPLESPTFTGTVTVPALRLSSTSDASPTSTNHALQIGPDSGGPRRIMDINEDMHLAADNTYQALYYFNPRRSSETPVVASDDLVTKDYVDKRVSTSFVQGSPSIVVTGTSGWAADNANCYARTLAGGMAMIHVRVTRQGSSFGVPVNGDHANELLCTVTTSAWHAAGTWYTLRTAAGGRVVMGSINSSGQVHMQASAPGANYNIGDEITLFGIYLLNGSAV